MGLVAPQHVGSSLTRNWTHVLCHDRWILNHWTTREVPGSPLEFIPSLAPSLNFPHFYLLQDSPGILFFHLEFSIFHAVNQCQVGFLEHYPPIKASTWKPGFVSSTRRIQSLCFSTVAHATQGPPCRGAIDVSGSQSLQGTWPSSLFPHCLSPYQNTFNSPFLVYGLFPTCTSRLFQFLLSTQFHIHIVRYFLQ